MGGVHASDSRHLALLCIPETPLSIVLVACGFQVTQKMSSDLLYGG